MTAFEFAVDGAHFTCATDDGWRSYKLYRRPGFLRNRKACDLTDLSLKERQVHEKCLLLAKAGNRRTVIQAAADIMCSGLPLPLTEARARVFRRCGAQACERLAEVGLVVLDPAAKRYAKPAAAEDVQALKDEMDRYKRRCECLTDMVGVPARDGGTGPVTLWHDDANGSYHVTAGLRDYYAGSLMAALDCAVEGEKSL